MIPAGADLLPLVLSLVSPVQVFSMGPSIRQMLSQHRPSR